MFDQIPTLADVCSAIAEGRLAATSDGRSYEVSAFELRRYFNERCSFPPLTHVQVLSSCGFDANASSLPGLCSSGL
jgi:hypothetical protein